MKQHQIQVSKTARYYTLGEASEKTERLLIAFHGYGQAAKKFVHKFDNLNDGKTLVVCPEGMNRFYWEKFTGDVVASWMTKEDREQDIRDNHQYFSQLFERITQELPKNIHITCLGFSQGCATLSRWLAEQRPPIHQMILWAGELAHDANFKQDYFQALPIHFVYGTEDPFLPYGFKEKTLERAKTAHLDLNITTFKGRHTVDRAIMKKVIDND